MEMVLGACTRQDFKCFYGARFEVVLIGEREE